MGRGEQVETILTEWVGTLAVHNYNTAKTNHSAVMFLRSKRGLDSAYAHTQRRSKLLRASKRTTQGLQCSGGIYEGDLAEEQELMGGVGAGTHKQRAVLGVAAVMLVGGMRVGEVAPERYKTKQPPKKVRNKMVLPPRALRRQDVKFSQDRDGVRTVYVVLSRTKWKNRAVRYKIHETTSTVDAFRLIREAYIKTQGNGPGPPLFTRDKEGKVAVVASDVSTLCKRIRSRTWDPEAKMSPHGFRVGAARSLLIAGVDRQGIDTWCRWASRAGDAYLRTTPSDMDAMLRPNDWMRASEKIMRATAVKSPIEQAYADGRRRKGMWE